MMEMMFQRLNIAEMRCQLKKGYQLWCSGIGKNFMCGVVNMRRRRKNFRSPSMLPWFNVEALEEDRIVDRYALNGWLPR